MLALGSYKQETAYMAICCEQGYEDAICEQLKTIDGVKESILMYGSYDILVRVDSPTIELLREIIAFKIRKIPHITSTTTLIEAKYI